jgi:hypothetical protein
MVLENQQKMGNVKVIFYLSLGVMIGCLVIGYVWR